MNKNFFLRSEITSVEVSEGVSRCVIAQSEDIMMCEVSFKQNSIGKLHKHSHDQATYVVSGEFEFTIGDKTICVKGHDSVYMEPDVMHGCKCIREGILVDVFTPRRDDFL